MLMFSSQTTPTNTSPSTKGICGGSETAYRRHATDSRRFRIIHSSQCHHKRMVAEKVNQTPLNNHGTS